MYPPQLCCHWVWTSTSRQDQSLPQPHPHYPPPRPATAANHSVKRRWMQSMCVVYTVHTLTVSSYLANLIVCTWCSCRKYKWNHCIKMAFVDRGVVLYTIVNCLFGTWVPAWRLLYCSLSSVVAVRSVSSVQSFACAAHYRLSCSD